MSYEFKKDYVEKLELKLKEWTAEFAKLKVKAESSETKLKEEYHKKLDELRPRIDDFKNRIQKVKESSEGTWEEVKSGTEKVWHDMKDAIDKAKSKFLQ